MTWRRSHADRRYRHDHRHPRPGARTGPAGGARPGGTPGGAEQRHLPPEELLNQIKTITEDGLYSVRFERDSGTDELVVKITDRETDEVIRQIPSEELLELSRQLEELRGNLVDTVS
jgi:hypothetical protein